MIMASLIKFGTRISGRITGMSKCVPVIRIHSIMDTKPVGLMNSQLTTNATRSINTTCAMCKRKNIISDTTDETITIIDSEGNLLGTMPLSEAQNLAKDNDQQLSLVTKKDQSDNTDVYKLDKIILKKKDKVKIQKIHSTIGSHDLDIKMKQIKKWLDKQLEVRIIVGFIPGKKVSALQ